MTRQPRNFASCPATLPTAPAAPEMIDDIAGFDLHQIQPDPGGHARHAQRAKVNRERLNVAADRMQLFRRSNEVFPPAKAGSDGIARLEFLGARLDDLADCAAVERFAKLERRNIRFPVVHATAHVGVHRHKEVANQHLLILQWLQFGLRQGKVSCGWKPIGAGGQSNLATHNICHNCFSIRRTIELSLSEQTDCQLHIVSRLCRCSADLPISPLLADDARRTRGRRPSGGRG